MTVIKPREPRARVAGERRGSTRFPVEMEVRFSCGTLTGTGRTIDMSSSGIFFTSDSLLPVGLRLDLSVDWPVRLAGGTRLQLITDANVVRSINGLIAVTIGRAEFKTRRAQ
jgi:hypothetical protein